MFTAEQLRGARAMLQMDQAELAKISGVSVETIKRLERQKGRLQAKNETIIAIQKALEAQHLEFVGDQDGHGAGVRLAHSDKLKLLREALIGEWAHTMDQRLKAQCLSDPKFFEHGENRTIQRLTTLSARILPTIVRSVLSDPSKVRWGNVRVDAQSGVDVERNKVWRHRVSKPPPEERRAFIAWTHRPAPLAMSAAERAIGDARHLTSAMLGLIQDEGDLADNRAFTRAFVAAIPTSERGALTNAEGGLSAEGLVRAKNAVLTQAYGDADIVSRITDSTDEEIKSISNGLIIAAPQWAKLVSDIEAGRVRADLDLTSELMEAVMCIADILGREQTLEEYLFQHDAMFHLTVGVEGWMRVFYDPFGRRVGNAPRIASALRTYVEEAFKATHEPGLGTSEVRPHEIQSKLLPLRAGFRYFIPVPPASDGDP